MEPHNTPVRFISPTANAILDALRKHPPDLDTRLFDFLTTPRTRYVVFGESADLRRAMFERRAVRSYHVKENDPVLFHYKVISRFRTLEYPDMPTIITMDEFDDRVRVYANRMGYTTVMLSSGPVDESRILRDFRGKIDLFGSQEDFVNNILVPLNTFTSIPRPLSTIVEHVGSNYDANFFSCLTHLARSLEINGVQGKWAWTDRRLSSPRADIHNVANEPDLNRVMVSFFDVMAYTLLMSDDCADYNYPMVKTHKWAYSVGFILDRFPFHVHSIYSTPSINLRWISYYISKLLQWHAHDPHVARREVLRLAGGSPYYGINDLHGILNWKGRRVYICVSGHLINYVLTSMYIPFNWEVYLRSIEWNFRLSSGAKFSTDDRKLMKNKELAEVAYNEMARIPWHNILEYLLAVQATRLLCLTLGLPPIALDVMNGLIDRFKAWMSKYPRMITATSITLQKLFVEETNLKVEADSMALAGPVEADHFTRHLCAW